MNRWFVSGKVVTEPKTRAVKTGQPCVMMRISIRGERRGRDGKYGNIFATVVAFGGTAQFVLKNVKAGSLVEVVGRLEPSVWSRDVGDSVCNLDVYADVLELVRTDWDREPGPEQASDTMTGNSEPQPTLDDDDVPF